MWTPPAFTSWHLQVPPPHRATSPTPAGPSRPSNIRLWLALTNGAWRSNNPGAFPRVVPAALTCESPGVPVNLFDLWPPLCAAQTTNKCSCDGGAPSRFSPTDSSGDWPGPRLLSVNKEWVRTSDYCKCFWLVLSMNVSLRRALFMLRSKTGRPDTFLKKKNLGFKVRLLKYIYKMSQKCGFIIYYTKLYSYWM